MNADDLEHPRLLLLRHGQIKANRQGRWHGSTDSPLTWRGRRQAAQHTVQGVAPGQLDRIWHRKMRAETIR